HFKPISISLSPNTEKDDIFLALKLIFQPWKWRENCKLQIANCKCLEEEFEKYFGVKYAFSFNSGRTGLMAILEALELNQGDEILLQSFTCNAVVNPILWTHRNFVKQNFSGQVNLKPVFIDCDEKTFNIDCEDLKRKIGPKSKAVLVQHTFGLPADIDEILEICEKNNLILIEDCAHSLGAKYKGKKVGTFGKAGFFSFSRDKIISSVYGGMAITQDEKLAKKLQEFQEKIEEPSCFWIFQQLLHPILMNCLILPGYRFFGKYILVLFQWFHILSKAVHWKEKIGLRPDYFPKKMPEPLAELALNQFKKLERFNEHRQKIAEFYFKNLKNYSGKKVGRGQTSANFELPIKFEDRKQVFLRLTIKHSKAHQIIKQAWKENILIGDWYTSAIAPKDTKLEKMGYKIGDCPNAEKLSKITFNLPTHINIGLNDAQKIINFLKKYDN
ncbi:DegT/DnrJ/EryC1/StrS family aminotransferase, partial [Patescibacteria group bacterium]|nr:DegT/DnrJ/EryC1/StrS family aminotransferase [Patescibacteria group bacterium]